MGCGGCERKVYNQHLKLKSFLQHLELNYQTSQPPTLENFREPNLATSSFIGRNSAQFLYHFEIFGCGPLSLHVCSRMKLSSKGVECISRVCESRELDKSAQQFQKAASKNQLAPKKIGPSRSSLDCTSKLNKSKLK